MNRVQIFMSTVVAGIGVALCSTAIAGVTADDIFRAIKPDERKQLESGEIITVPQTKQETSDTGLAVSFAVIIPADPNKTLTTLRSIKAKSDPKLRRTTREISGSVSGDGNSPTFAGISFAADEKGEVAKLLSAKPGDDFNFSKEELAWVRQAAAGKSNPEKAAAGVMRRVLESRYVAYRNAGLKGCPPYARSKGMTDPGAELAATTETMVVLKQKLPDFYNVYRNYPKADAEGIEHSFFWEKKTTEGRPMFSLLHDMVQIGPDGATIASREFYISNSLNTLQVVIVVLPYGKKTLVALVNQSFTEKVAGAGRFVSVQVGRKIVASNIKPLFVELQKTLGRTR